jgi:hypothetical protein
MENRRKPAPPAATLDINCDCKEFLVDYLTAAFPVRQMRTYTDDSGTVRSDPRPAPDRWTGTFRSP